MCLAAERALGQDGAPKVDRLAEIAAIKSDFSNRDLVEITPPPLVRRLLPIDANGIAAAFRPSPKLATAAQLRAELRRQRELFAPYLKDLSPPLEDVRIRLPLESFAWRIETAEDRANFAATLAGQGRWQQLKIPHYGAPMGRAVTYYRTTFEVTAAMLEKGALFVHFQGVDYKAHIFLNGAFLGSH